jgi:hypothetical protein
MIHEIIECIHCGNDFVQNDWQAYDDMCELCEDEFLENGGRLDEDE